jgi:LPXTG-site transpeptidase (sortase) family protein
MSKHIIPAAIISLWKPFVIIFAVLYIAFNWQNISWLFNYKVAGQYISDLKPEETPAVIEKNSPTKVNMELAEEPKKETGIVIVKEQAGVETIAISIPKIGIKAPIVISDTSDNNIIHKYLDLGVVLYPDSVMPGETGETLLLGHSAPAGWPKIKFDWVFSRVSELKAGDIVTLVHNGQSFDYAVTTTVYLMPGEELPATDPDKKSLFLISCWPPGKDFKRIAVEAVMQN